MELIKCDRNISIMFLLLCSVGQQSIDLNYIFTGVSTMLVFELRNLSHRSCVELKRCGTLQLCNLSGQYKRDMTVCRYDISCF